jgi:23S rRNA (guanosine2251-2'-O)-methyltransferase
MILIAHNIRSLHNVGAFFRTADAFGVEKIYLTGYTGCPPRKEIAKTALGSEHRIPWEHRENIDELLLELKSAGKKIVALEISNRAIRVEALQIPVEQVALIVGSEVEGISQQTLEQCDEIIEIPMIGVKKSLNVSVATGIALFAITTKIR